LIPTNIRKDAEGKEASKKGIIRHILPKLVELSSARKIQVHILGSPH
jgi:hypothetical protein